MSETHEGVEGLSAHKLVSEFMRELPSDQVFDAKDVIRTNPVIQDQHSAIVDLAYEEYCRRRQQGEEIDVEEFAGQFPDVQATLLQLASLDKFFKLHGDQSEPSANFDWPTVGDTYLEFNLLEELGRGKFSRVFLAREMELGERTVALKVCYTGEDEAQILGKLQHDHIVPVNSVRHDFSTNLSAISLPFLGRSTLGDVLNELFAKGCSPRHQRDLIAAVTQINSRTDASLRSPASEKQAAGRGSYVDAVVRMGSQIASALAYSHEMGIFHGDIKPSNILVTESGDSLLFDFNLAVNPEADGGRVGGTLPYMAPEQLEPIRESGTFTANTIDAQSEIFSLGVTLYEALSGHYPFGSIPETGDRKEVAALLLQQQQAGAKSVRELNPQVDPILAALIDSALQPDPRLRPQTADQFAQALGTLLAPQQRVRRCVFNHPRLSLTAIIVVLAATIGGIAVWQSLPTRHEREMTRIDEAYDAERYTEVVTIADEVLATSPNCLRTQLLKAQSLMESGRFSEAAEAFETLQRQQPLDDRLTKNLSYCFASLAALENQRRTLEIQKSSSEYRKELSESRRIESGYWGAAISNLESITSDSAKDVSYYVNLGSCSFQASRFEGAKAALDSALKLDGSLVRVHLLLAEIERQKVLPSNGDDRRAHLESAQKHLDSAFQLMSADPSILADFYYQQGITHATVALISMRQDPAQAESSIELALGDLRAAVSHGLSEDRLRRARGIAPQFNDSAEFDELLEQSRSNQPAELRRWLMVPASDIDGMLRKLPCQQ